MTEDFFHATCFYDVFIEESLVHSGIIEYLKRGMVEGFWGSLIS